MEKSVQQIEGENLLALAEQIRLDSPSAKLSEIYDWAVTNGINLGPAPQFYADMHYNGNGSSSS